VFLRNFHLQGNSASQLAKMALTWEGWTGTSSRTGSRAGSTNASRIMGKTMAASGYKKNFFYPEDGDSRLL